MKEKKIKILVVDSCTITQLFIERSLCHLPVKLYFSHSSENGYFNVVTNKPDIIFLEASLAKNDNISEVISLYNELTFIPVIVMSKEDHYVNLISSFRANAVDFLGKPFTHSELFSRLYIHLNSLNNLLIPKILIDKTLIEPNKTYTTKIFNRAIDYLSLNMDDLPSLTFLSHVAGTNERKLTKIFMDTVGVTVFDYHSQYRLNISCDLLLQTNQSIKTISLAVGYHYPGDFTRAFKKRIGVNPSLYRKNGISTQLHSELQ